MKKERKGKDFILKPRYPGGPQAMKRFIGQHLQYPKDALEKEVSGTVHLKITINYKGAVTDVKVLSSVGHGCDEEAVRIAKLLKFEVPKNRKVRALFHKKLNIHFRLPAASPDQQRRTINYKITQAQKDSEEPPKPGKSYEYTINW